MRWYYLEVNDYIVELLESIDESINSPANLSLPDPSAVTFYQNLKERKIWINLGVDETMLEFAKYIALWNKEDEGKQKEERKPIWVYIFCYGGSMDFMWMFADVIAASETPVYTVNMGQCASAAAIIFMTGHKRFMLPSASVLIHEGSGTIAGDAVKVFDQAENYRAAVKRMHNYILAHTNIPSGTLAKKRNNDWELDSETCLKYGVCDRIIESLSEIN